MSSLVYGDRQSPADFVFTPNDAMNLGLDELKKRQTDPKSGVPLHIPAYDRATGGVFNPMRPGDLVTLIARPGHYKTGLMLHILREEASDIMARIKAGEEDAAKMIVVYATWEIAVEEAALMDLAAATRINIADISSGLTDQQYKAMKAAAARRSAFPLWILGFSLADRQTRPIMTMEDVRLACKYIEEELGFTIRIIGLDYLNQMHSDERGDRRLVVMNNVTACKNLAFSMGCPVLLAAQARREVDDRKVQIPLQGDGMETSNLEHTSDKIIGLHYLKKVYQHGETVEYGGSSYVVTDELLWTKLDKQRYGAAGEFVPLQIDPGLNRVVGGYESVDLQGKMEEELDKAWTN